VSEQNNAQYHSPGVYDNCYNTRHARYKMEFATYSLCTVLILTTGKLAV